MPQLFDVDLRRLRRDRAARVGPALFAHRRAFDDILERLADIRRDFATAVLLGTPDPGWPARLQSLGLDVRAFEPGALFAAAAGATHVEEMQAPIAAGSIDLCIAAGTLDTIDELPIMLALIRGWLKPDGLLIGAMAGGDTLPQLRSAMRAADAVEGSATPHVHPRIAAASLAGLLADAGFAMPVVDVDRVRVSYRTLGALVADLRAMAAGSILAQRPRAGLSRAAYAAAEAQFQSAGADGKTVETFEILHFAGWAPQHG
ncbi:class I SAM-dependent methyltransferase [Sphingomonas sinipercae]|uniref:Class I SAM-dependent methyltransferase n=1 Tax=Sphingomonas sinipercae TaxID=2714944 RepID=A0A6G7ZPC4_9SPHN|nr:class I SAM-dependent methyltransferase [Sphingomonas sinipercae]QIL02834.1 class I SAM-dependent methyltransferase [Sphingomonas sinipercae]